MKRQEIIADSLIEIALEDVVNFISDGNNLSELGRSGLDRG